jgi:hypothetical protein
MDFFTSQKTLSHFAVIIMILAKCIHIVNVLEQTGDYMTVALWSRQIECVLVNEFHMMNVNLIGKFRNISQ